MHWQIEAWKCAEPRDKPSAITDPAHARINNKTKNQCGQVFYRREQFYIHLDETHKKKDAEYVRKQCKLRRVGRNGQRGFWCGFCQTVVSLKKKGLEAWDERFTHIDEEHFKKGERVDNWFPMDKELPKGILDEEKPDSDSGGEGAANSSDAEGSTVSPDILTSLQSKHAEKTSEKAEKVLVREWVCCVCRFGPLSRDTDLACFMGGCEHMRCRNCKTTQRTVRKEIA